MTAPNRGNPAPAPSPPRPRVLVAEDDRSVRESLRRSLVFNGFDVAVAVDGADALAQLHRSRPEALVLDVMMPRVDGLEVCRILRAAGDELPILALTARDAVADRVAGLDAGADDYLVKPFDLAELLARLRALLRRAAAAPAVTGSKTGPDLVFDDLRMDTGTREVFRGARPVRLTRTEFALLEMLLRHPRTALTRERILEDVWGFDFATTANSLEVYVGYLRRKTEAEGEHRLIHTVRGVGYALRESPP